MRNSTLLVICALLSACGAPAAAVHTSPVAAAGARAGSVWQFTYLKAMPGQHERLAAFIERNWFAMDARAKRLGYLVDNQLFTGTPADTSWDVLEVSIYADSLQHARIDSLFRTVISPAHVTVPIDGLRFNQLGRIVREETVRWRARSP